MEALRNVDAAGTGPRVLEGGRARALGEAMDRAQLERVDRELFRLARGQGRARLQMGEGLAELVRHSWHRELGFSTLASYSYERLSLAGRTVSEMRVVARRLAELPATRRALTTGRIGWSTAEVLARHATPETERELLERAEGLSVRALRAALKARARNTEDATASGPESEARSESAFPSEPGSGSESGSRSGVGIGFGRGNRIKIGISPRGSARSSTAPRRDWTWCGRTWSMTWSS